jgi:predicted GNAT family N-acyltransferase
VPEGLEWDGLDESATHVLASDADGRPVGTGRLLDDGRIGRIAVLAEHRGRGVGSAILQRLIETAAERGLARVSLHAQVNALEFYRRHGFQVEGGEFLEAGIPHRRMTLALEPAGGRAAGVRAVRQLVAGARSGVDIFLDRLDKDLLDDPGLLDALQSLLLEHPNHRLRLCVQRVEGARAACPRLYGLLARLPSRIEMRQAAEIQRERLENFVLVDRSRYLRRPSPARHDWHQGDDRSESDRLTSLFDEIWLSAEVHPELRTLSL